jgi:hypothetical protein
MVLSLLHPQVWLDSTMPATITGISVVYIPIDTHFAPSAVRFRQEHSNRCEIICFAADQ